jgi:hypothetical protein
LNTVPSATVPAVPSVVPTSVVASVVASDVSVVSDADEFDDVEVCVLSLVPPQPTSAPTMASAIVSDKTFFFIIFVPPYNFLRSKLFYNDMFT